jgi:hypothetical protein
VESPKRRPALLFAFVLATWVLLVWIFGRARMIALDWHGWRQADTQVIALHFTEPGARLLYPRIDWGGAGPGYVEAEFQLYPWLVSRLLLVVGDAEWPGQLVSLAAIAGAVAVLWREFAPKYGAFAAAIGALTLLTSRAVLYVGTAIQPEALCLFLYVVGWTSFLRYEANGSRLALVLFAVSGGLAMLVKPTAAQLGISSFVLLALSSPKRLKRVEPWLAWAAMVLALGAHLLHARGLYEQYGNTFGVLAGSDSKVALKQFLAPRLLFGAAVQSVIWGLGPLGFVALLVLVARRRIDAALIALFAGNAVWTLLALRYASGAAGTHYHVLMSVVAAHAVARTVAEFARRRFVRAGAAVALGSAFVVTLWQRSLFTHPLAPSILAAGEAVSKHVARGTLVAVRSTEARYATDFHTLSNYQDPRIHYLSRTRGFVLPLDELDPRVIERMAASGARFYVEPEPVPHARAVNAWLDEHAVLVATTPFGGRVFRL